MHAGLPEGHRQLCPQLIQCGTHPKRYAEVSRKIMTALDAITPDLEVFSVDEAFLDVTRCQRLLGTPDHIGKMVQELVYQTSGLRCSVGVSGDKTTAKYAAKLLKPNGLTIIPPWEAKSRLKSVSVNELCGIGPGITQFLARHGVHVCGDMERLPISVLSNRFGDLGRRIWYMCQGADPYPVETRVAPPKSMGHGKVMPPNTREKSVILTYMLHMSEKLSARLRRHQLEAQYYFIGLRHPTLGWLGGKTKTPFATQDGACIFKQAEHMVKKVWYGEGVSQVQITALDPHPAQLQMDLFHEIDERRETMNQALDDINQRFRDCPILPARLLNRSEMPNVIAPAWKPNGHRETVE